MTPREIVAKWIETEWFSHDPAIRNEEAAIVAGLVVDIEQAITAAVEEDRKTRQHQFIGRNDRGCELCGEPDRDEIHIHSRETYKNWLKLAVEAEREACAKIVREKCDRVESDSPVGWAMRSIANNIELAIRARSTACAR